MVFHFFILFLTSISLSWGQGTSPVLDPDKFTVCAITINSDDEKKLFDAQIKKFPDKYNPIVELTTMGEDDWFKKACESGIRCDQLVISGHFAGKFFGYSGKELDLKQMEEAGCSKTCDGIMNQPYEVFLFGCNTLAEKDLDHRTPAQYLQVLLDDGMTQTQAELVVQSRYGAVGDSNRSSMQRAFSGLQKQLYGFNSVGPSGKNVKGFLSNYFTRISAPAQLEKQAAKRAMGQVEMGNQILADSLSATAFSQCASVDSNDEKTKKVCGLLDTQKSTGQKLALTMEVLAQEDYLLYLPTINSFIKTVDYASLSPDDQKTFDEIKNNNVIKSQLIGLIDQTSSLTLKVEWIQLAEKLGYLTKEQAQEKITPEVAKFFDKPLSEEAMLNICNMDYTIKEYVNLKDSHIKSGIIKNNELSAFSCLSRIRDVNLLTKIATAPQDPINPNFFEEQKSIIMTSAPEGFVVPAVFMDKVKKDLNSSDTFIKEGAFNFIAQFEPENPTILPTAKEFITKATKDETYHIFSAIDALERAKKYDPSVADMLIDRFQKEGVFDSSSVKYIIKSSPKNEKTDMALGQALKHSEFNEYDKKEIIDHFKNSPPVSTSVYDDMIIYAEKTESEHRQEVIEILKQAGKLSDKLKQELETQKQD
jgi:hypothetical protein